MPDPLARVSPGSPLAISSVAWNTLTDMARDWKQGRPVGGVPAGGNRLGTVEALALNSTGAALREYKPAAVTAAGGYDLSEDFPAADWSRRPLLTLGAPASDTDYVVVTLEAIPAGAIGRVAVSGVCLCDVDSADGATFAAPQVGDTSALLGGTSGTVRVLHVPSAGGSQKRCAVYLHEKDASAASSLTSGQTSGISPLSLSTATGVYTAVANVSIPSAGTYLITFSLRVQFTASVAGSHMGVRLFVPNTGITSRALSLFATVQAGGVTVQDTATADTIVAVSAGGTVQLEAAMIYASGTASATLFGGSAANASGIRWVKIG